MKTRIQETIIIYESCAKTAQTYGVSIESLLEASVFLTDEQKEDVRGYIDAKKMVDNWLK
jgi:hypothetical protein